MKLTLKDKYIRLGGLLVTDERKSQGEYQYEGKVDKNLTILVKKREIKKYLKIYIFKKVYLEPLFQDELTFCKYLCWNMIE